MKRHCCVLAVGLYFIAAAGGGITGAGEYTDSNTRPERVGRERAMDRVVHIEDGIFRDIPKVPRLCDSMEIRKEKVDVGGCNLYCEQEGEGIPLVLINGGPGGTHHCFHPHFSSFRDFARIIYYDQRGCGLSDYEPGKGYTVDQAVEDLDRLRQALGIDRWAVLGFSYGGLLAQCYATKYPENVQGLILVASTLGFLDLSPSRSHQFISTREREKFDRIINTPGLSTPQIVYNLHLNGDWKRQNYYCPSREDLARMARYEWVHDKDFRDSMCPSANRVDLEGAFKDCPIPTLIMEGKWDMGQNAKKPQRLHENHPNARLVVFKESAHSIFEDEPEAFFVELRQFLSGLAEISDEEVAQWKQYLAQWEKEKHEKWQEIPEGPMTEQEKAEIDHFHRMKKSIQQGRTYDDASIPLRSLLSLISACTNEDLEGVRRVRILRNPNDYDFDSKLHEFRSLQIFRAPMPPEDADDGDIWIIYTKASELPRLDDALIFIMWKGNWMLWGTMGRADAAVQWRLMEQQLKERLVLLLQK